MENETKKRYGKWIVAAAVAAVVCLLACGITAIIIHKGGKTDSETFDAYTDELFKEEIAINTVNLHYTLAHPENYGITDYDVSLGDFSIENIKDSYQQFEDIKEKLLTYDRKKLTESQRLTYDVLMDYVETELSVEDLYLYEEVLEPTNGYQSQFPIILAEYTFRTERDIEDYLELLSEMDEYYAQLIAFEEKKAEEGLFMSDSAVDDVIGQCEEFIKNPENNYMIEVFNDKIDSFEGISEEKKEEYRERHDEIINADVVEGYQILIDGLTELKGSGRNELGLCYFEDGKEYYEYLIRSKVGTDASVKKLQRKIEKFIGDYIRELYDTVLQDMDAYEEALNYQLPDMEPDEILQDLMRKMEKDFPEPPQVDYNVKYVHPSMQDFLNPAFYLTTPIDDIQNNFIYINEKYTGANAGGNGRLYTTLAHEGYPGHLYQNAYTASSGLPLVRNLFSCQGYVEGWATYVEYEYGYEYAYEELDKNFTDFLAKDTAVSMAIYAYIDLGIHYDGWDREDVSEFLSGFMDVDEETVNEVFDAIVTDPAGYLSYFAGYLEILELREDAMEELGGDFDIKEFHDFLLSTGPAPFYIIEDYMDEWMKAQ
ncbi:MAG: DUF885 domain-containing protein [Lachnospiraceae bacterium]|nr:DUF885 domain-containing protein [Lachnospiraceae bacterium]